MQKVLWTKGVLLSPQHLQMQDRYIEETIGFQLSSLAFYPWGFSSLQIDRDALAGGLFSLTEAVGIFPDGMPFEIPRSDPAPPPRPLDDSWLPDQGSLDIYLAIPEHRVGGHNVSASSEGRNTRYRSEVELRRDENTGLAEKPVQVARKNFRLIVEGESLDGYASLPIARVTRAAGGKNELDPHFVPPLVGLAGSEYLLGVARRLVEILSAKSSTLAGYRRQRNQGLADFGVSDVANFWLLYTVNTHLPEFRHLHETRRGHPSALFAAMSALAGALTTFSSTMHPRALPPYDHTDLAGCFGRLDATLRELLETVVPTNHVALPLRLTDPSIYATAIDQDRYFAAPQIFLAISADLKQPDLIRKVPQLLKVSSGDQIERLIKQALPGVGLKHTPAPPNALPIKLNYQYFQLERSGQDWDAIKRSRNLAAYIPSDFPDPQVELVILLPTEASA
jgi:type VI secretion system protein ImpJ